MTVYGDFSRIFRLLHFTESLRPHCRQNGHPKTTQCCTLRGAAGVHPARLLCGWVLLSAFWVVILLLSGRWPLRRFEGCTGHGEITLEMAIRVLTASVDFRPIWCVQQNAMTRLPQSLVQLRAVRSGPHTQPNGAAKSTPCNTRLSAGRRDLEGEVPDAGSGFW